jgi:hypothetical protein
MLSAGEHAVSGLLLAFAHAAIALIAIKKIAIRKILECMGG